MTTVCWTEGPVGTPHLSLARLCLLRKGRALQTQPFLVPMGHSSWGDENWPRASAPCRPCGEQKPSSSTPCLLFCSSCLLLSTSNPGDHHHRQEGLHDGMWLHVLISSPPQADRGCRQRNTPQNAPARPSSGAVPGLSPQRRQGVPRGWAGSSPTWRKVLGGSGVFFIVDSVCTGRKTIFPSFCIIIII